MSEPNRQDAKDAKEGAKMEPDQHTDQLAHGVIGAAIEVHRALGPGFLESAYEEALAIELQAQGVPFERQRRIALKYRDRPIGEAILDLLVDRRLVVELKAVESLAPIHQAQVISYLRATGLQLGLLINFNVPMLRDGIKRVVVS